MSLPTGTVTFLFTDIEGSTRLWEQHPEAMRLALARHDALLRAAIETNGGTVFKTMGDQFCAVFFTVREAIVAALSAQRALLAEPWGEVGTVRVRMALHTGAAEERGGDYFGPPLNRAARLLDAGHGQQILLSRTAADRARDALPGGGALRDLGAHRLKDLQQPEHLYQLLHPDLPDAFPTLRSLEGFAHNLPRQLTSFVGREREMEEVKRLLDTTALLTLTGAGGCGKTRLALQIAADVVDQFTDGVWLVALAALTDPALVPQTVAAALGVREEPRRALAQTLVETLEPKRLLLLLDNCEHLLAACAQLVDALLSCCSGVTILTTSREGLNIAGEQAYRVPSLALPEGQAALPLEQLQEIEAVRLFTDRAVLGQPSFAVTPANAAAVAQVCRRLDGIPLAIELAAARVRALPVDEIAERLDDRFRLLTGGSRTALPRHQTLQACIDWSYDHLSEPERALLRRLSVFRGGWALDAAESICAGGSIQAGEILDLLAQLVDKSLVEFTYSMDAEPAPRRYALLETIRQYARDRLLGAGDEEAVCERHRDWFLRLAEEAEAKAMTPEHAVWLDRLGADHDNVRAALDWSLGAEYRIEGGLRFVRALWSFWQVRCHPDEAWKYLEGMLEQSATAPAVLRARAMTQAGLFAQFRDDDASARRYTEESLALSRRLEDATGVAGALQTLGNIDAKQGKMASARRLLEESLAIWRELGVVHMPPWLLCALGLVAWRQEDRASARAFLEEGVRLFRQLGNEYGVASSLTALGRLLYRCEEYRLARSLLEESQGILHHLGARVDLIGCLESLAWVACAQGEHTRARAWAEESLAMARETGTCIADSLVGFAGIVVAKSREGGNAEAGLRAARLLSAVEARLEASGTTPAEILAANWELTNWEITVTALHDMLSDQAFASAWDEGRAMTLEDAVTYALQDSSLGEEV